MTQLILWPVLNHLKFVQICPPLFFQASILKSERVPLIPQMKELPFYQLWHIQNMESQQWYFWLMLSDRHLSLSKAPLDSRLQGGMWVAQDRHHTLWHSLATEHKSLHQQSVLCLFFPAPGPCSMQFPTTNIIMHQEWHIQKVMGVTLVWKKNMHKKWENREYTNTFRKSNWKEDNVAIILNRV